MVEFITKSADYVITIKDKLPIQKRQSFSFSINHKYSMPEIIEKLKSFDEILLPENEFVKTRYQVTIISKKGIVFSKSFSFNTTLVQTDIYNLFYAYFQKNVFNIYQNRATHHIQVINMHSKERDSKCIGMKYNGSVESLRDLFQNYSNNELKTELEDNIIFSGEQQQYSHRVLVFISKYQFFDKNKDQCKSKSFSIKFPYYSSDEIIEYFKRVNIGENNGKEK